MKRFRIPEIALGVLIGIVLSLFFGAIGSYHTFHCTQHQQTRGGETQKPSTAAFQNQASAGHRESNKHGNPEPFACGAVGLLPAAIAFMDAHEGFFVGSFTGFLVVATVFLWLSTRNLVFDAKHNAERQMRAYVGIWGGAIEPQRLDTSVGFMTRVEIRNSGQTPAYELRTWIRVQIDEPTASPFDFPADLKDRPFSILFPSTNTNIDIGFQTTPELFDDIRNGKKKLFVWGRVEYRDAFGGQRHLIFRNVNGSFVPKDNRYSLGPHSLGEEAD